MRTFPPWTHEKSFNCVLSTFVCELYIIVDSLFGNHLLFRFERQNVVSNIVNTLRFWKCKFISFFCHISHFFTADQFCKLGRF